MKNTMMINGLFVLFLCRRRGKAHFSLFIICFNFIFASAHGHADEGKNENAGFEKTSDSAVSSIEPAGKIYIQEGIVVFNNEEIYIADTHKAEKAIKTASARILSNKKTVRKNKEISISKKPEIKVRLFNSPDTSTIFSTSYAGKTMIILPLNREYKAASAIIYKNTNLYTYQEKSSGKVPELSSFFIQDMNIQPAYVLLQSYNLISKNYSLGRSSAYTWSFIKKLPL